MKITHHVIGLMSGTSLDGLDIAYCTFFMENGNWHFKIHVADTISYNGKWIKKLQQAHELSGIELLKLHNEYGAYLGRQVTDFIKRNKIRQVDLVSSHGHTIFHQPKEKFTFQLGSGAAIAAVCKCTVVNDFRSLDVALNGQGAPLVPVGDQLLFKEYEYCINLGGFANISYHKNGKRIAFDICPVNMALNYLAQLSGKPYDKNGGMAAKGRVDKKLLQKLNALAFYKASPPKSLGREWFEINLLPVVNRATCSNSDKLATLVKHITEQLSKVLNNQKKGKVLLTGGGAFNTYLVNQLQNKLPKHKLVVPGTELVKYKEALIFAFLGVLRYLGKDNCLKSVTGANINNKGGAIYLM